MTMCRIDSLLNREMILNLLLYVTVVTATSVQMRVVRDTASYGYRYTFCPFQNFSQYELSSRWNAYHGVLGVWSHWDIKNNTFHSMVYNRGDQCGDIERSVQVYLQCGQTEILINVSEPSKCHYSAIFQSKYLCHNDSLLVYPRLTIHLRRKWDQLLTEYKTGDITEKGYLSSLQKLFQSAGLLENTVSESPEEGTTQRPSQMGNLFTDLTTCNKEYKNIVNEITRLNQEIDSLKLLLDLSKLENRTSKPHQ
uniref:Putative N-acetylglucosamine-1-phosphotransferase gamma n=1 Tax=Cupiennius salei TaxID=6928 RepID=T1D230_CUPSA